MQGVVSPLFLGVTLGSVLAIRLLAGRVPRDLLLIAASVVFIFLVAGGGRATLAFWLLVFGGFAVVSLAPRASALPALLILVAVVVTAWWWLRDHAPAELAGPGGVVVFGLSYAMFRIIHLTVDARDGELGRPLTLRGYLCYLTFFPNYLSGPVQRFQHFAPQVEGVAAPVPWAAVATRAITGVFKCTALAGAAMWVHEVGVVEAAQNPAGLLLAQAAFGFAAWLYFSFTGYMDIVIPAAQLLGVQVPENFDRPLTSRNFLDVWARWHITLSEWFKFYVFNPTLKAMLEAQPRPSVAPWLAALAFFLTFFVMGVWHGRTPAMVMYGLVLGGGVSVNKLYQVWMGKRLGKRAHAALNARPGYQVLSQALAIAYFVMALAFLWPVRPDMLFVEIPPMITAGLAVLAGSLPIAALARASGARSWAWPRAAAPAIAVGQLMASAAWLWWSDGLVPPLLYQWL
jgi:alginate O-acetyltransferase complex protein AlgI